MAWWDKEKPGDEVQTAELHGVDALGMPCFWKAFRFPCAYCKEANKYYDLGDKEEASKFVKKRTLFGLALFSSTHEDLKKYNNKVLLVSVPVKQLVGEVARRIKMGEAGWENDPSSIENGFVIAMAKEKPVGARWAEYLIARGKDFPLKRDAVIKIYEKLDLPNPKQDKYGFFNWMYNVHPELVLTSWSDIPPGAKVGFRFIPWPWKTEAGYVPETEYDPEADPFKLLYFHRLPPLDDFHKIKESGFDSKTISAMNSLYRELDKKADEVVPEPPEKNSEEDLDLFEV